MLLLRLLQLLLLTTFVTVLLCVYFELEPWLPLARSAGSDLCSSATAPADWGPNGYSTQVPQANFFFAESWARGTFLYTYGCRE